jgi:acetyl-CoA carboxylase biotin carboxyl carrier protein
MLSGFVLLIKETVSLGILRHNAAKFMVASRVNCKPSSHEREEDNVSNAFDSLNDDEVRQISQLVETLDRSTFDFLQLEVGNLKVTIGKGNAPPGIGAAAPSVTAPQPPAAPAAAPAAVTAAPGPSAPAVANEVRADDGTVTIVAPLMGRFYAKPEPGAAPFVSVGAEVNADTTVGLIEVMKVFTAVRAGISGVVTEICVQDAEFIEYGHVLFRVRPAAAVSAGAKASRKGARS